MKLLTLVFVLMLSLSSFAQDGLNFGTFDEEVKDGVAISMDPTGTEKHDSSKSKCLLNRGGGDHADANVNSSSDDDDVVDA